uniref:Wsv414-like protein n=1 Tax=Hemigrapsus takanoi nimavirus TaxID=2133792 RepID=A0A401IP14_9VIRU|nr:MAG: wsv414-like protein [Hemigrapsus takanoi nimavirus]GBG35341.1 wsv414-like protein [Hemigrapsus takanoi nimavirus]
MTTPITPFGAAAAGGANLSVAGGAMSISRKLMTVLTFTTVFSIILITVFVMNIMWAPASGDKIEECGGGDSDEEDENKCSGTTKGAAIRNYIGVAVSTIMLVTLLPGFYFTNAM